jgi:hypothetical protein
MDNRQIVDINKGEKNRAEILAITVLYFRKIPQRGFGDL